MSKLDLEKYQSISGFVRGGTPRFSSLTRKDILSGRDDKDEPISMMVKDKVMYNQIKNGNGSDKSLKKDAHYLQKTYTEKKKAEDKAKRYEPVKKAREKYKRRYKQDPI